MFKSTQKQMIIANAGSQIDIKVNDLGDNGYWALKDTNEDCALC